jgi:uncharacterized protein YukE
MDVFGVLVGARELTILVAIAALISFFAIKERKSRRSGGTADYKALIVSIGVLGTFIGIFLALWAFDTNNIQGSVPNLLEGLKLAFATSILGMGTSVVLSAMERGDTGSFADEGVILASMDGKLSGLEAIAQNSAATNEQLRNFRMEVHDEQLKAQQFVEAQFTRTNESLDKAIETLAEGATSEIIQALETVIQGFNENLTEQFGDNFTQLNEAVHSLVTWQENYRLQVEHSTHLLEAIAESLKGSDRTLAAISERNQEILQLHSDLEGALEQHFELLKTSGAHISTQQQAMENLQSSMQGFQSALEETSKNVTDLTTGVRDSVTAQSKALKTLTDDIESQLPKALGELDSNLAGLTQRFASDYESFMDRYRTLVGSGSGTA